MKKIFIFLAILLIVLIGFFIIKSTGIIQYKSQNAYITSWHRDALKNFPVFTLMQKQLQEPQNGNYKLTYLDFPRTKYIAKNEFYLVNRYNFIKPKQACKNSSYLWQVESPIKINLNPHLFTPYFKKVFTYNKIATNNKNIIFLPITYEYPTPIKTTNLNQKEVLLTQVAGNHKWDNPYCIYDLREKAVIWFLENHPQDFIFYGKKWQRIKSKLSHQNQIHFDTQYAGYTPDKRKALSKAKFALTFENAIYPHYVTEKIFDVITAGTVPIYMGAPNIKEYVPEQCFINFEDFKNFEELYNFISTMSEEKYFTYINCINEFLKDPTIHKNHPKNAVKTLLEHIELTPAEVDFEKTTEKILNLIKKPFNF